MQPVTHRGDTSAPGSTATVIQEVLDGDGLSLAQAARLLPSSRRGRPVSPSTLWRWAREGITLPDGRRLHLEHCRVRGKWLTSRAALGRWIAQQSDAPAQPMPVPRTPGQRDRATDRAAAELDKAGL